MCPYSWLALYQIFQCNVAREPERSVEANSGGILDSVNGYRKVKAIARKKVAAMASCANNLPGDYVQEQASSENDCPELVEQHSLLFP